MFKYSVCVCTYMDMSLCMHIQCPEKDVRCPAFETRPLSEISWTDDQQAPEITL